MTDVQEGYRKDSEKYAKQVKKYQEMMK